MPAYLAIAGKPREELDLEEGATAKDILATAGVVREEGENIIVADREVDDSYELGEGETLVYIPGVSLG